ncbi:MAG: toxic anion resistance protein [Candidatus Saccharimonas sp.]
MIGPELAAQARALAYATSDESLYTRIRNNSVALRNLGIDTLEQTNRVINELFEKENFDSLSEAADLLRSLRKDMKKLTLKYNPGDPKILEWYQKWQPNIADKLRGIKSIGQLIMIDISPLKAQMSGIEKDAKKRLEGLDDTLAYYDQMLRLAESEIQTLMYVIAVMEYVVERASNELKAMPEKDPKDPLSFERDALARFIRDMDTKLNDFKARLWLQTANAPRILEMKSLTQSVALRMVGIINLVIPSMKQAIIDWNKAAATVESAKFINLVTETFNEVVQANANATNAAVPILLNATETPMLSLESVYALGTMYDNMVKAVDSELAIGAQKKAELRQAQAEVLGRILDDKQKITEAYVRQALANGATAETAPASGSWQSYVPGSVDPQVSDAGPQATNTWQQPNSIASLDDGAVSDKS